MHYWYATVEKVHYVAHQMHQFNGTVQNMQASNPKVHYFYASVRNVHLNASNVH